MSILPSELVRKRYWSKKYPLCLKGVSLTSRNTKTNSSAALSSSPSFSSSMGKSILASRNSIPSSQSTSSIAQQSHPSASLSSDTLILFARTDREKEEWFKLFKKAAAQKLMDSTQYLRQQKAKLTASMTPSSSSMQINKASDAKASENNVSFSYDASSDKIVYKQAEEPKQQHQQTPIKSSASTPGSTASTPSSETAMSVNAIETQTENGYLYDKSLAFLNTFLIRAFADFFNEKKWINLIQTKIQKKLSTIKVPYFMEELRVTDIDLGSVIPLIKQAGEPWYDEKGLWVHLDIDYSGGLQMSLATKLNLLKLKQSNSSSSTSHVKSANASASSSPSVATATATFSFKNSDDEQVVVSNLSSKLSSSQSQPQIEPEQQQQHHTEASKQHSRKRHLAIVNSDEEDSPESSGDEYVHMGFNNEEDKLIET